MNEKMDSSDTEVHETPASSERAATSSSTHSDPQRSNGCAPEHHQVNPLPLRSTDLQQDSVHESVLGQSFVNGNDANAGQHFSNGNNSFENTLTAPANGSDTSHVLHQSQALEQNEATVESVNSAREGRSLYSSMVEEMHKQVEKVTENDFLVSVNLRASENSSPRLVTFNDEVEEYIDPKKPPVVRSLSSDDLGSLDFQNLLVKRPVTRRQGKRPVQRGEPMVDVRYDEEVSAVKADPTFFCVICQSEQKTDIQRKLDKCQHVFCTECIKEYFAKEKPVCPICNTVYGEVRGNMPPGVMSYYTSHEHLPGYERAGVIIIEYDIPDGTQTVSSISSGSHVYYKMVHCIWISF
jgi:hypothetical protein